MEIYLLGTSMFMIMEVNSHFSFEAKAEADRAKPKVQQWEELRSVFRELRTVKVVADGIFKLNDIAS
jgi:L-rhamnose mutarotase